MEVFTVSTLNSLSYEKDTEFQSLLPIIVKKLIKGSIKDLNLLRIPPINTPGFDGVVSCTVGNEFVASGDSVWEFGNSNRPIEKIRSDYRNRTKNPLGVDKTKTTFYLVSPKTLRDSAQKERLENNDDDWKAVRVLDAVDLCDWLNQEPAVASWLLAKLFNEHIDILDIENAWNLFANKTNPTFTVKMFLENRETETEKLYELINKRIVKVKSSTLFDAIGFVLSSFLKKESLFEKCIVVNNHESYKVVSSISDGKIIILNYASSNDFLPSANCVISCYNIEDSAAKIDIDLKPYTKYHYLNVFKEMGMNDSEAHELYAFCHGNLRALIRRIPGLSNDCVPEWKKTMNAQMLLPILYLRTINTKDDKALVEQISGEAFNDIEIYYNSLLKKEDSPIKKVNDNYILVNYEEAWDVLMLNVEDPAFKTLHKSVIWYVNSLIEHGIHLGFFGQINRVNQHIYYLLLNYVYYSFSSNDNAKVEIAVSEVIELLFDKGLMDLLTDNLKVLAEAAPTVVLDFIEKRIKEKDSKLLLLFITESYLNKYVGVLNALEELVDHDQSAIGSCRILFSLYQNGYEYKIMNSPKETLLNVLCLYNNEVALSIDQKEQIIKSFYNKDARNASTLICDLLDKTSFYRTVRYGKTQINKQENLFNKDIVECRGKLSLLAWGYCFDSGDLEILKKLLSLYFLFSPDYLRQNMSYIGKSSFDGQDTTPVIFQIKERIFNIQRYRRTNDYQYLEILQKWVNDLSKLLVECDKDDWAFYSIDSCPSDSLLEYTDDYNMLSEHLCIYRKNKLQEIYKAFGMSKIIKLAKRMDDNAYWGSVIACISESKDFSQLLESLIENNKGAIIGGIISNCEKDEIAESVYSSVSNECRKKVLAFVHRPGFDLLLYSEEEKKEYWLHQLMYAFEERAYSQLLKYNPAGLLWYCYTIVKEDSLHNYEQAIEVVEAIKNASPVEEMYCDEYLISEIIKMIDLVFYSDQWALVVVDLFNHDVIKQISTSGLRFLFDNPNELNILIDTNPIKYEYGSESFELSEYAFENVDKLVFFVNEMIRFGKKRFVGNVIGKHFLEEKSKAVRNTIQELLEQESDTEFDNYVAYGALSSIDLRTVLDGSDRYTLASKYEQEAKALDINYPHSAYILRMLSKSYRLEGEQDYVFSEIYDY